MKDNENEKRETVADILTEYRNDAYAMDRGLLYQPTAEYVRRLLDRIETAWKREREAVEADALAVGGIVEASRHKPGNAAAMREALKTIHDRVNSLDEECGVDPVEVRDLARAALAAPPRQCDVGTAEEQAQRFEKFCKKSSIGGFGASAYCAYKCACKDGSCCEFTWSQMPYEAKEGGAK